MGKNYYTRAIDAVARPPTMTVGELMRKLNTLDPNLPVIFRSPKYGAFGSMSAYSIESAELVSYEESTVHHPASIYRDDETGERRVVEECTDHFAAWDGVVIT